MSFHKTTYILIIIYLLISKQAIDSKNNQTNKSLLNKNIVFNSNSIENYKQHICNLCLCKPYHSILCFNERRNEISIKFWKNITINSSHFNGYHKKLKQLTIDMMDYSIMNIKLRIQHNTFSKMKNLEIMFLNNINDLMKIPNLESSENLREITIQNSNLKTMSTEFCYRKNKINKIDLSYNDLLDLKYAFDECINLTLLDISHNRIKSLSEMFNKKLSVINLLLTNNQIEEIGQHDLSYLTELIDLSMEQNRLKFIHENAFDKLLKLKILNLSKNNLYSLPQNSPVYNSLEIFVVNENVNLFYFPNSDKFLHLKNLHVHYSYHCCPFLKKQSFDIHSTDLFHVKMNETIRSNKIHKISNDEITEEFVKLMKKDQVIITAEPMIDGSDRSLTHLVEIDFSLDFFADKNDKYLQDCANSEKVSKSTYLTYLCNKNKKIHDIKCSPKPDPFTPCENLLEDFWLRIAVWLVSSLGVLSNICVIAYNVMYSILYYYNNNDVNVSTFLLTNLATADSLMSIYLLFIALKDATSRHTFGQSALEWQRSFSCNLAGFLSVVSSVASALCLAFITFERYYSIRNSFHNNKRISIKVAFIVTLSIWLISLLAAALPLFDLNSYSAYAICLPFDTRNLSYKIYIICLNGLLVLCFFFICICYGLIFISTIVIKRRSSMKSCNNESLTKMRRAEDQKLAKNISMLVLVNIFCWGPVVYVCAYSLITMSPMNRAQLKILAIFVIPFNSLINPFLYCISRRSFRMYLRANLIKYKIKRDCGISFSSLSTTLSTHLSNNLNNNTNCNSRSSH